MVGEGLIYLLMRNREQPHRYRCHQCPWLYDAFCVDVYAYVSFELMSLVLLLLVDLLYQLHMIRELLLEGMCLMDAIHN